MAKKETGFHQKCCGHEITRKSCLKLAALACQVSLSTKSVNCYHDVLTKLPKHIQNPICDSTALQLEAKAMNSLIITVN